MVFSSIIFLFCFLPLFLLAYYATPKKLRNLTGLAASLFFYSWGEPKLVGILILGSVIDFFISKAMVNKESMVVRKRLLTLSIFCNVGFLLYFKYAMFFLDQFAEVASIFGKELDVDLTIILPLGISFYTFQRISYVVDVYSKKVPPARSFVDFLMYVSLFPQLIAGPIVRYHDIQEQLKERTHSLSRFADGVWRFVLGLAKKVLIANPLAQVADTLFAQPADGLPFEYAWLGVLCYAFQIYFDFSGYSDMAIGLGKMMGFEFLENFNRPYISRSITEFWRRWHISLSNWMREYLYIPLGGNRISTKRTYINLWLVFLISGFWHGASWNFIIWGVIHGSLLCLEKTKGDWGRRRWQIIPTFIFVCFAWVFFRAETLSASMAYIANMCNPFADVTLGVPLYELISHRFIFVFILAAFISFAPTLLLKKLGELPDTLLNMLKALLLVCLIVLCVTNLINSGYNPFIYFRF